jgi:hypothetical protein
MQHLPHSGSSIRRHIQNFVARATFWPIFVHPCFRRVPAAAKSHKSAVTTSVRRATRLARCHCITFP